MYRRGKSGWFKHLDFMMLDMLCLELSLMAAYVVRNGFVWPFDDERYARLGVIIMLLHVCIVFFFESYKNIVKRGYLIEIKAVLKHNTLLLCAVFVFLFATKQTAVYSRIVLTLMWEISFCVMLAARLAWKRVIRRWIRRDKKKRSVLVAAYSDEIGQIIGTLKKEYYPDFEIVGAALLDGAPMQGAGGHEIGGVPVVAERDSLLAYVKQNVIDEVFLGMARDEKRMEMLINRLINMGVIVHVNIFRIGENFDNKIVERFGQYTVVSIGTKFASDWKIFVKRCMDIAGALAGLLLTGVIFVIFAPVIYVQSPGPVFFSQIRVGRNGRKFKLYKFRSMYPDAEERKKELMGQNKMQGLMFKMDNDPRVIPIGRFMRKASLDEFPQFWNVLKGEMSLVGTRPPTVEEYEQYEGHHKLRLAAKPGITGMWQVSGRSNIVDFEEIVALDAKYISEWDLTLDLKILWKTLKVMVVQDGAV